MKQGRNIKQGILSVTALLLSSQMPAQEPTYIHDESFKNQFLTAETGASGDLQPGWFYALHPSYRNTALGTNKALFRKKTRLAIAPQVSYSETVDTALAERAKNEAWNLSDRIAGGAQALAVWATESSKIEGKMDQLRQICDQILPSGGPLKAKEHYEMKYKMMQMSINTMKDAYLPSGDRQKQFIQIYNDLLKLVESGNKAVAYYRSLRQVRQYREQRRLQRVHIKEIAEASHLRWSTAIPNEKITNRAQTAQ